MPLATAIVTLPDGATIVIDDLRWAAVDNSVSARAAVAPRLAYAAAHIVMRDSYAEVGHSPAARGSSEEIGEHIDWDATVAFRRHMVSHGMGIAEAMDTAQRFDVGWPVAQELIRRCAALRPATGFVAGAGTDHLSSVRGTHDLIDGVVEQCGFIQRAGGIPIILPMAWLSMNKCGPEVYVEVYTSIAHAAPGPVFLHWLGPMFLASLAGYFPGDSFERIMAADPVKIRGAKLSLLDRELEIRLRRVLLERDQIMLTGDDFNFASLIEGDGPTQRSSEVGGVPVSLGDFSHALLGILDAIAAPAGLALRCIESGRNGDYRMIMTACERLGRKIFEAPTSDYKAGLAFVSWLNGLQSNPMLPNHVEGNRSRSHLIEVAKLASEAGAIADAPGAARRLEQFAGGSIA